MNYRHAFHAGNFADVLKHFVLAFALSRLGRKAKPFRFVDTHAGIGAYDLTSKAAQRSPEFHDGVGRLWSAKAPAQLSDALAPYLDAVRALNPDGALKVYPGSPALAAQLMRPQDALRLCELHAEDSQTLRSHFAGDKRVKIEVRDGYEALPAYLPPPERRGLVLVDPPFEHRDELAHMARAAMRAIERWPTGTFIFWRPLKDLENTEKFDDGLAEWLLDELEFAPEKILLADLWVREIVDPGPLCGAGVVVVNPPFGLQDALLAVLPWFSDILAQGPGAGWRLNAPELAFDADAALDMGEASID